MELQSDIFEAVAGHMPFESQGAGDDRRQYKRFPIGSRATIVLGQKPADGPQITAILRDISLVGIGFLSSQTMKVGDLFTIRLTGRDNKIVRIQCAARHCEAGGSLEGTQYAIGATFEKVIDVKDPQPETTDAGHSAVPRPPMQFPRMLPKLDAALKALHAVTPPPSTVIKEAPASPPPAAPPAPASEPAAPAPAAPVTSAEQLEKEMAAFCEVPPAELIPIPPAPEAAAPVAPPTAAPANEPATVPVPPRPITPSAPMPVPTARNQELLSKVKSMFLDQRQALESHTAEIEKFRRELDEQKQVLAQSASQRDQLQAQLARADQQLTEEKVKAARETDSLRQEVADLQQAVRILQTKSDADDKAITELASLATGTPIPPAPAAVPTTPIRHAPPTDDTPREETLVATVGIGIPA